MSADARPSSQPTVSVIIPTYNYAHFIGQTIQSLQAQTHGDWECIVVDDGSTDNTPDVVAAFRVRDSRIRSIRQPNRGQPAARNSGLSAARGRYVQLLDADDLIEPDKLLRQVEFLEQHPDVDIVYGDARFFPTDRSAERWMSLADPDQPWMPRISGRGNDILKILIERNIMVIESPLIRRRVFDDVGGFDEQLARADDWDMWIRCAVANKRFEYRDEPGTYSLVRAHPQSLTRRDRRLLASLLAIHRKLAAAALDPAIKAINDGIIEWLDQVHDLSLQIDRHIPAQCRFILVDDDKFRPDLPGYPAIPFTEHEGRYNGTPANSAEAIAELNRLRSAGADFIIFARPAMWHLDHYREFRDHLDVSQRQIHCDARAVIYDLRPKSSAEQSA